MASIDKPRDDNDLSREREQEIVDRILKRAELAQMTRQLKMNLSKIPNPNVVVNGSSKEIRKKRANAGRDPEIEAAINRVSPKKNCIASDNKGRGEDNKEDASRIPIKTNLRPMTPPPAPPASSSSSIRSSEEPLKREEAPMTPRIIKNRNVPPVIISGAEDSTQHQDMGRQHTPHGSRQQITTPKRGRRHSRTGSENDVGADLLMYLATSPYTSASSLKGSRNHEIARIPTTPMAFNNRSSANEDDDDAARFSHIKPSTSSPQSTFKVPMHVVHSGMSSSGPHAELLMDSPSLYMATSPSPQKRKFISSNSHEQHTHSSTTGLVSQAPSTPSRELRASSSHLLKTPNFNMGDYVHNLFSPSPRVNTAATTQTSSDLSAQRELRNSS